jgi:hypothetical protein
MNAGAVVTYGLLIAGGALVAWVLIHGYWRGVGLLLIRRAGRRPLGPSQHQLWEDRGAVERLDLAGGPGGREGAPRPPFTFLEEHASGSQPCVSVRDAAGRRWRVKWGAEVNAECFAVRFAWACGYFAETTHFVRAGTVHGAGGLQRARACIGEDDGRFADARFELDDPAVNKLFEEHSWAWNDNPFLGSAQLSGLKIVVMLLSNWDTKDRRDVARGSNTAIFEMRTAAKPWGRREARYLITDWGGAMGKWGTNVVSRGRWDCDGFEAQTPSFVTGIADGIVNFGYVGQRTADIARGITVDHVRWFHRIAGQLREHQLVEALAASGATPAEQTRFARALLARIDQLGSVSMSGATTRSPAGENRSISLSAPDPLSSPIGRTSI